MSLRAYENVAKAAADPSRVRILKILEGGEMSVCQVIAVIALAQSTIAKHLFLLRAAGLIQDRRYGKWVHYSLGGKSGTPYAGPMLRNLRKWLNDDPVVRRDLERAALARAMGPVALCARGMTLPARKRGTDGVRSSSREAQTDGRPEARG
jgi:DNA-binding transcriptional ArsR family regulator